MYRGHRWEGRTSKTRDWRRDGKGEPSSLASAAVVYRHTLVAWSVDSFVYVYRSVLRELSLLRGWYLGELGELGESRELGELRVGSEIAAGSR